LVGLARRKESTETFQNNLTWLWHKQKLLILALSERITFGKLQNYFIIQKGRSGN